MRSRKGIKIARPGWSILLNFPILSTTHAVCCGTKRMMVLAGREGLWKYVEGAEEDEEPAMAAREEGPAAE